MIQLARIAAMAVVFLTATACFSYRGPRGVEDALEQSLGVELHRDVSIKLGPLSTRLVASFVGDNDDGLDLHGLTSIGLVVFERGPVRGHATHRIQPSDLGLKGYETMVSSSDGDEQVLILVKPREGSIHDMALLAVDADEVVFARLTGRLDELLAKAMDEAEAGNVQGVRAAVPLAH
jgi:hypothetical protein